MTMLPKSLNQLEVKHPHITTFIQEYVPVLNDYITHLDFPSSPHRLYSPLRYFLELNGKRTRPILTLLGCQLFGEDPIKAINVALAIELFHNFTLIHDDIMDEAPLRRGKPTIHKQWSQDVAILSGDVLYTKAFSLLTKNDAQYLSPLFDVFNQTAIEVCEGQQLDMDFEKREEVSLAEYIEMIRLKTSVLIGAALEMGAILANANDANRKNIYAFGVNIGLAFQIQDDLLDLYADPKKFGKQIGGDIIANKKTFLVIKAIEIADNHTKENIRSVLSLNNPKEKIEAIKLVFEDLEIRKRTEQQKQKYYLAALDHLNNITIPDQQKEMLKELAKQLMTREI